MTTLADLRQRCQEESDNVGSSFVQNSEWQRYINGSYTELYGLLIQSYGNDYYVQAPTTGYTFTTDGINQFFALPTDMFKLLGVDALYGGQNQWVALRPFAFGDRNKFSAINSPIPAAGQQIRLFYVPTLTQLAGDSSATVDLVNGWEEYIVVDAAMKALAKEESDVSVFMSRKQSLVARINAEAENRDAGMPAAIVDSRGRGAGGMQYRLNGNQLWLIGFNARGWPGPEWDWAQYEGGGW